MTGGRLQCKTDFKFLKWQALQHNHPLWYQRTEQPKVHFIVPLWKCSGFCPPVFIYSCKYGGNIQFFLVHSSKICVHFKLILGHHAVLLDSQQDVAFSIIKARRNIHYRYPSCCSGVSNSMHQK